MVLKRVCLPPNKGKRLATGRIFGACSIRAGRGAFDAALWAIVPARGAMLLLLAEVDELRRRGGPRAPTSGAPPLLEGKRVHPGRESLTSLSCMMQSAETRTICFRGSTASSSFLLLLSSFLLLLEEELTDWSVDPDGGRGIALAVAPSVAATMLFAIMPATEGSRETASRGPPRRRRPLAHQRVHVDAGSPGVPRRPPRLDGPHDSGRFRNERRQN